MRVRLWSSVLSLVVIACLLFPAVLFAADASAATAVDPNNAAASGAPTNSGASVGPGSVINPSLVDLLVKKGISDHHGSQQSAQRVRIRRNGAVAAFAEGEGRRQ